MVTFDPVEWFGDIPVVALSRRRLTRLVLSGALLLALAACGSAPRGGSSTAAAPAGGKPIIAWAPPPEDATEADKKAAGELVGLFMGPCLDKFPDDGAVAAYAKAENLTPMTETEIRQLLGSDPGVGWVGKSSTGVYRLTVEEPPYHTCALRAIYAGPPKAIKSLFFLPIALWAVTKNQALSEQPTQSQTVNGLPTLAYPFVLVDAGGKTVGQFAVIVTDIPDGSREARLVRQMLPG
jgi:hypothetical protein